MNRREFNKILTTIPFILSQTLEAKDEINNISVETKKDFKFYNQLHFKNMQDVDSVLDPISFVYAGQMWKDKRAKDSLDPYFIKKKYQSKKLLGNNKILILDIENWKVRRVSDNTLNRSISNFNRVIEIFRSIYPGVNIGLFEYGPRSFYPLYDQFATGNVEQRHIDAWQEEIIRLRPITDNVDILVPQLYSRWPGNHQGWEQCAREVMLRSRQIAKGRPVIPVIRPEYWLRDKSSHPIVQTQDWKIMLRTVYEIADSVVLWSISATAPQWKPGAEWWKETKSFISNRNQFKNDDCI